NEVKAKAAARSLDTEKVTIPKGVGALFSCSQDEVAWESDKLKHGVFFHFVLKGLRGGAAREGVVTWSSLTDYVTERVSDEVGKIIGGGASQTPHEIRNIRGVSPVLARAEGKKTDKDGGKATVVDADDRDRLVGKWVLVSVTMNGKTKEPGDATLELSK